MLSDITNFSVAPKSDEPAGEDTLDVVQTTPGENWAATAQGVRSELARLAEAVDAAQSRVVSLQDVFVRRLQDDRARADMYATIQQQVKELSARLQRRELDQLFKEMLLAIDLFDAGDLTMTHAAASRDAMLEVLYRRGVAPIPTEGKFDPNIHDGVRKVPAPPGFSRHDIVGVERRGYSIENRVLRPARVVVADTPVDSSVSGTQERSVPADETGTPPGGTAGSRPPLI